MMRHPLALLAGLIVVAGLEWWAFAASAEPDPATVRFVIIGSCLLMVLLWFLGRSVPAAATPAWPASRHYTHAPFVDARTRQLETLLSRDTPVGSSARLAVLLGAHVPSGVRVSPGLTAYVEAARAGRGVRRPSAQQLARWLSEIEDAQ